MPATVLIPQPKAAAFAPLSRIHPAAAGLCFPKQNGKTKKQQRRMDIIIHNTFVAYKSILILFSEFVKGKF